MECRSWGALLVGSLLEGGFYRRAALSSLRLLQLGDGVIETLGNINKAHNCSGASSTTGRCRESFSTMVEIESIAKSVMATHAGFGVMTVEMLVEVASTCFATTLSE